MLLSFRRSKPTVCDLIDSQLFDHKTFYSNFLKDLDRSKEEIVIESPFLTTRRVSMLLPALAKLKRRGVKIVINTRDPLEQEGHMRSEAELSIELLHRAEVSILFTGGHHRKLAIIDRKVIWEGSLNILSQNDSCEIMRRTASARIAKDLMRFIKLDAFL